MKNDTCSRHFVCSNRLYIETYIFFLLSFYYFTGKPELSGRHVGPFNYLRPFKCQPIRGPRDHVPLETRPEKHIFLVHFKSTNRPIRIRIYPSSISLNLARKYLHMSSLIFQSYPVRQTYDDLFNVSRVSPPSNNRLWRRTTAFVVCYFLKLTFRLSLSLTHACHRKREYHLHQHELYCSPGPNGVYLLQFRPRVTDIFYSYY